MARRDLASESALTAIEIRVRFCETDLMGIVHHANYFAYFEAGRVEWLRRRGITYATWAARGIHLPVVEANVQYRAPARFDDLLRIDTCLEQLRSCSVRFSYVIRTSTGTTSAIVQGSTRLACLDSSGTLMRIPDDAISVFTSSEKESS